MQKRNRLLSIALAAVMLHTLIVPVLAVESNEIHIRTSEELSALSRRCTLDSWSVGKVIYLDADIDLTDTDFAAIPTFGGTFDGQNHTISGLSVTDNDGTQGLFRYVQSTGTVKNLTVSGTVEPAGDGDTVGGLSGSNSGKLVNCAFSGIVSGGSNVGGLTGINKITGQIINSTFAGEVIGEHYVGGVVGYNEGSVIQCVNKGEVNTFEIEVAIDLQEVSLSTLRVTQNTPACTDIGGIAGMSTGILQSCSNFGQVGYEHMGYNVGGIVGRQSGWLDGCDNSGTVRGRKDVGGIAGQTEPKLTLLYQDQILNQLWDELDNLEALVDNALSHADGVSHEISTQMTLVTDNTTDVKDAAFDLSEALADWGDDSLEQINDLSARLSWTLNQLDPVMDTMEQAMDLFDLAGDQLSQAVDEAEIAGDWAEDAVTELRSALNGMHSAIDTTHTALTHLKNAVEHLKKGIGDEDAIRNALDEISDSFQEMAGSITDIGTALHDISTALDSFDDWLFDNADIASLKNALNDLVDSMHEITNALSGISSAAGQLAEQGVDSLLDTLNDLETSSEQFNSAMEHLRNAGSEVVSALEVLRNILPNLSWRSLSYTANADETGGTDSDGNAGSSTDSDGNADRLPSIPSVSDIVEPVRNTMEQFIALLQSASSDLSSAVEDVKSAASSIQNTVTDMRNGLLTVKDGIVILRQSASELDSAMDRVLSAVDDIRNALNALDRSQVPEETLETLEQALDDMGAALQVIGNAADSLDSAVRHLDQAVDFSDIESALDELSLSTDNLNNAMDQLSNAYEPLEKAMDTLEAVRDQLDIAGDTLKQAANTLDDGFQILQDAASKAHNIITELAEKPAISFSLIGDSISGKADVLDNTMTVLSDSVSGLNQVMLSSSDVLLDDLRAINAQFGIVVNVLRQTVEEDENEQSDELLEDVSDQVPEDEEDAAIISNSANSGTIEGDINTAGIVGSMAIEYDYDLEDDLTVIGDRSLDFRYQAAAITRQCVNTGAIAGKKDYVGGIVGRMDMGIVNDCESYGSVESTDGNNVGGIAGGAWSTIRDCWAKCALSGGDNIGGIAGLGKTITGCHAMVEITEGNACLGAVLGSLEDGGEVTGNQFTSDELGGIDGISYTGQTDPVTFQTLISGTNVPDAFTRFQLIFAADGQIVDTVDFSYGDSLETLPEIPAKEGCTAQWPALDYDNLTFSYTLEAEYTPYATAVSVDSETPQIVAEGTFSRETEVSQSSESGIWTDAGGNTHSGQIYTFAVHDPLMETTEYRIHYRLPEKYDTPALWIETENGWRQYQAEVDGSYLVFSCADESIVFSVVDNYAGLNLAIIVTGLLLAAAIVGLFLLQKRKRAGKKKV